MILANGRTLRPPGRQPSRTLFSNFSQYQRYYLSLRRTSLLRTATVTNRLTVAKRANQNGTWWVRNTGTAKVKERLGLEGTSRRRPATQIEIEILLDDGLVVFIFHDGDRTNRTAKGMRGYLKDQHNPVGVMSRGCIALAVTTRPFKLFLITRSKLDHDATTTATHHEFS